MKKKALFFSVLAFSNMASHIAHADELHEAYSDDVQATELTSFYGFTNISGLTSNTAQRLKKEYRYENGPVYAMCQDIYATIATIRQALFGDNRNKLESVINDKKTLSEYIETNHAIIQDAIVRFKTQLINFTYHTIPCIKQWTGVSGVFGLLHVVPFPHMENTALRNAADKLYDKYFELANFFRSIESFYTFIEQADCSIKSNDALIALMQEQIYFRANLVIGEFENTYQAFEALANSALHS